jgi:Uma2 family endonuclease
MGGQEHTKIQQELLRYVNERSQQWGVRAYREIRIQTSASHVRVADVALLPADAAVVEGAIDKPPVTIFEILAPDDRLSHYADRLDDYRRMDVKSVWVVDPVAHKGFDASTEEWNETTHFESPGMPIQLDLTTIFAAIEKNGVR